MFKIQPRTKSAFGFDKSEEEGLARTAVHANGIVKLFDSVLQMLGPDTEFIEEILAQVGRRHKVMGINPAFFPYMGQALVAQLETVLGADVLTKEHRQAWEEVFDEISGEIVKAILA